MVDFYYHTCSVNISGAVSSLKCIELQLTNSSRELLVIFPDFSKTNVSYGVQPMATMYVKTKERVGL